MKDIVENNLKTNGCIAFLFFVVSLCIIGAVKEYFPQAYEAYGSVFFATIASGFGIMLMIFVAILALVKKMDEIKDRIS